MPSGWKFESQKQNQLRKSDINLGSLHALLTAKHLVSLQRNSRSLSNMVEGDVGKLSAASTAGVSRHKRSLEGLYLDLMVEMMIVGRDLSRTEKPD